MLLSIPKIHSAVPKQYLFGTGTAALMETVIAFAGAGLLDQEINECSDLNSEGLRSMLENAIRRHASGALDYQFVNADFEFVLNDPNGDFSVPTFALECNYHNANLVFIERLFSDLYRASPDIAIFSLRLLSDVGYPFGPAMTPFGAIHAAKMYYWSGEEDELAFYKAWGDEGVEESDTPTKNEIFSALPPWAYVDYSAIQPSEVIDGLALLDTFDSKSSPKLIPFVESIRNLALNFNSFHEVIGCNDNSLSDDYPPGATPFFLRWNEADELPRIYDDIIRDYMEGGSDSRLCYFEVTATIDGVNKLIERIRNLSLTMGFMDKAISAIEDY